MLVVQLSTIARYHNDNMTKKDLSTNLLGSLLVGHVSSGSPGKEVAGETPLHHFLYRIAHTVHR